MRKLCLLVITYHFALTAFSACINTFPYIEDFEATNGGWASGGTGDDWAWGSPTKTVISQAASGSNCWITGGLTASFYTFGERSYVQSPCFDFTSLQHPYVTFNIYWESEKTYDGTNFQYSLNGGTTWLNVGSMTDPADCLNQNWYNTASITNLSGLATAKDGWAGNIQSTAGSCQGGNGSNGWKLAKHCMSYLAGQPSVIFRFTFGAGTACNNFDGIAFDDVTISEAPTGTADFTYTCTGSTFLFTGTNTLCPTNFTWDFGDGNTGNGLTTTHSYAAAGTYNVIFTASGNCNAPAAVTKQIQMMSAGANSISVLCNGGNNGKAFVTATGGSGYTYSWNTAPVQTTDTAFNLTAGNYSVTVSAPNFCDATASIVVNEPAALTNNFSISADTCSVGVGKVIANVTGGTSPYGFNWSNGASTSNQINNLTTGNYSVTITDVNNCTTGATAFVALTSGIFIQVTDSENVSCYGTRDGKISINATGGVQPYTYQWSNSANAASLNHLDVGVYTVTVADANNCSSSDSVVLIKEICASYIYFPTAFSPNADGVNETFKPRYSIDLKKYSISVYNRWGELVYQSTDITEGWDGTYKNTAQPISVYVWYAEYSFLDGKKHTETGNVTIIR